MLEEHRAEADRNLHRACVRLTRQQWYNQKHTSISAFCSERGMRAYKAQIVKNPPQLTVEDYMSVSKLSMKFYIAYCIFNDITLSVLYLSIAFLGNAPVGRWKR